jgi:diacylglycerol kinase
MLNDHHPRLHYASFKNAWNGFYHGLKTERNLRVHLFLAAAALLFAYYFQFDMVKQTIVWATILLVLAFEMLNSSIEFIVDAIEPNQHPLAKASKDAAAAAVTLVALLSAIVGIYLFLPPILNLVGY